MLAAPGVVPGRLGDFIPAARGAGNGDHSVVNRAAADRGRPGIKDPLIFLVVLCCRPPLEFFVRVMLDEKLPVK